MVGGGDSRWTNRCYLLTNIIIIHPPIHPLRSSTGGSCPTKGLRDVKDRGQALHDLSDLIALPVRLNARVDA